MLNGADSPRGVFPSEASFPLICQNEVIGVLCVFSQEAQYFRKDIVELLEQLAMEASFALDSLHREADRRRQAAVMADQNRILNLIASGAELKVILTTLAEFVEAQSGGGLCSLAAQDAVGAGVCVGLSPSMPPGFDGVSRDAGAEGSLQPFSARPIFGSKDQRLGTLSLYKPARLPSRRRAGCAPDRASAPIWPASPSRAAGRPSESGIWPTMMI